MADLDDRDSRWPDLFVLAMMATNVVLNPPNLRFLSSMLTVRQPFRGDVLAGVVGALGTAVIAAYAAFAASRSAANAAPKLALVLVFAFLYVAVPTASDVAIRRTLGLEWNGRFVAFPHDRGVLQTEAAMDFLLRGVNPYAAHYGATPMARSSHLDFRESMEPRENPALAYFPDPPLSMLVSIPFRQASHGVLGWYDQRFFHLVALAGLAAAAFAITGSASLRVALVALLLFAPWQVPHFVQGWNDVVGALFLVLACAALRSGRATASGVCLALACGAKPFAWLGVPLWLAWLAWRARERRSSDSARSWARPAAAFAIVAALLFLPFVAWDAAALFRDLVIAPSQETPVRASGLGFSSVLVAAGWVRQPLSGSPLVALQAGAVLAALAWGAQRVLAGGGAAAFARAHAFAALASAFFSRHFTTSDLWLPSVLYVVSIVVEESARPAAIEPA